MGPEARLIGRGIAQTAHGVVQQGFHPGETQRLRAVTGLFVEAEFADGGHRVLDIRAQLLKGRADPVADRGQTFGSDIGGLTGLHGLGRNHQKGRGLGRQGRIARNPCFRGERGLEPVCNGLHPEIENGGRQQRSRTQYHRAQTQAGL